MRWKKKLKKSHCVSFRVSSNQTTMAMLQPQMKAPEFKGTAVVNGEFKEVTIKSPQESCTFANTFSPADQPL